MNLKEMKSFVAGMYNQPYKESQDDLNATLDVTRASQISLTQVVAVAGAIETKANPTAPSLGSLERGGSASGSFVQFITTIRPE